MVSELESIRENEKSPSLQRSESLKGSINHESLRDKGDQPNVQQQVQSQPQDKKMFNAKTDEIEKIRQIQNARGRSMSMCVDSSVSV